MKWLSVILFLFANTVLAGDGTEQLTQQEINALAGEYVSGNCSVKIDVTATAFNIKINSPNGVRSWRDGAVGPHQEDLAYPKQFPLYVADHLRGDRNMGYFTLSRVRQGLRTSETWYLRLDFNGGAGSALTSVSINYAQNGLFDFFQPSRQELSASCNGLIKVNTNQK